MREIKYSEALSEATVAAMEADPRVLLMGEGIDDPKGAFGTTSPALKQFGSRRVFDTPLSENAITGAAIGAAIEGHACIFVHMRSEFALYSLDQILNHAAKWRYMSGGKMSVPIVIRCLVGRGWGQAAQHSQSFHAMYAQIPGIKVILPSNAYDAKGLLYSAIQDPNPVICIEHRWLYDRKCVVPAEPYGLPIGKANVVAPGKDVTCVAVSYQVGEAIKAREILLQQGVEMEIIDIRSAHPLDMDTIIQSVKKTGVALVTDISPKNCGISAEIAAGITEKAWNELKAPVERITQPDAPTPCSWVLEEAYYPTVQDIVDSALRLAGKKEADLDEHLHTRNKELTHSNPNFVGPF